MARRRITITLDDGRKFSGITGLKYELNASRIKRARQISKDGFDTEAGAVMSWCVATDNGEAEGAPTLDEMLEPRNVAGGRYRRRRTRRLTRGGDLGKSHEDGA